MNICIDIGNTFTKTAVFEHDTLVHSAVLEGFDISGVGRLVSQYNISRGIISSVKEDNAEFNRSVAKMLKSLIVLGADIPIPVVNHYQTPETLGKDRLAAVVGANYLYPGRNILVIDAGSAVTFDFINDLGEYKGGNIAPGLSMRFRSLNEFTSRLPLMAPQENVPILGRNTSEAIVAGVQNSIIFETQSYIRELTGLFPGLITVITGGDAKFFDNKLKNTIFVIPNLVLIGLNRILNFNA